MIARGEIRDVVDLAYVGRTVSRDGDWTWRGCGRRWAALCRWSGFDQDAAAERIDRWSSIDALGRPRACRLSRSKVKPIWGRRRMHGSGAACSSLRVIGPRSGSKHLTEMDSPSARAWGCRPTASTDPLVTYKREAFDMFDQLTLTIRREVTRAIVQALLKSAAAGRGGRAGASRRGAGGQVGARRRGRAVAAGGARRSQRRGQRGGAPGTQESQRRREAECCDRHRHGNAQGGPQRALSLRLRQEVQEAVTVPQSERAFSSVKRPRRRPSPVRDAATLIRSLS